MKTFGTRAHLVLADLRHDSWAESVAGHFNAVVSATALHWLSTNQLNILYGQIGQYLEAGGIFLNADHVGSDSPLIRKCWEERRQKIRSEIHSDSHDWISFWKGYSELIGLDTFKLHNKIMAGYEKGVEEGMPLVWHFDKLRESGFDNLDCFWRCDCDAIYGGIKSD